MNEMEVKTHHAFGGSTAKLWSSCYGWQAEMKKLPEDVAGPAAIKGTAIHTAVERKVKAEVEHRLKGTPVSVSYKDIPVAPEEAEEIANAFWDALWKNVLEQIVTGKQVYVEHKLMLSEELDCGGSADVVVLYRDDKNLLWCVIGDLKTGFHRVEPSEEQLLFYLCAANERARSKGVSIDRFKSFVFQPTHSEAYTEHVFTKKQVETARKKYLKAIAESKKDRPKYKVGSYCQFCRAQATCVAYNKHISKEMDLEVIKGKEFPPVESLSDEQLLRIWRISDAAESYFSAVRKHMLYRFSIGQPLEGVKIVSGVAKRKWKDKETAKSVLIGAGIDPTREDIVGIVEAEKMLKASGKKPSEVDAIMYTITEKPTPPPKLVELSDKREAIDVVPKNLLDGLDESWTNGVTEAI